MTERQKLFCETYLSNGYNALDAYHNSFGNKSNKKPSYPYTLLKMPEIKEYIAQRRQEMYESLNLDSMRVISELADIAFADKGDEVYNVTAKLKALEQLSKNMGLQANKLENNEPIEVQLVTEDKQNDN